MDMADIIILTLPSIQTKNLIGHFLPDFVLKDLENIQYESRASCSFVVEMDPKLAKEVCTLFGPEKTEINFDLSSNDSITSSPDEKAHLMIWQDRKSISYEALRNDIEDKIANIDNKKDNSVVTLSFTIHSTAESFDSFKTSQEFELYAQKRLRTLLITDTDPDRSFQVKKSRCVLWVFSQPSAPMETLYTEVKDMEEAYPYGPAYVDKAGLVLAGDYFTQSSYVGCFCSAATAVRAVKDIVETRKKISITV